MSIEITLSGAAPAVGAFATVTPVARRIHSRSMALLRVTDGSFDDDRRTVFGVMAKPSPDPLSSSAGIGTSATAFRAAAVEPPGAAAGAPGCAAGFGFREQLETRLSTTNRTAVCLRMRLVYILAPTTGSRVLRFSACRVLQRRSRAPNSPH